MPLIQKYGDDERALAVDDAGRISARLRGVRSMANVPDADRPGLRDAVYHVNAELKTVSENKAASAQEKAEAKRLQDTLHGAVVRAGLGADAQRGMPRARHDDRL